MNTPAFLLAVAILFWGWQTGHWMVAVPVALLVEGPLLVRRRWSFAPEDFNRVADLCTVLAVGIGVVLWVAFGNPAAIKLWFQWLPVALLPLVAMQAFCDSREIDMSVLFWSLRREPLRRPIRFNLGYPYLALWLLAASTANASTRGFYAGLLLLAAWTLWGVRSRSASPLAWAAMIAVAASAGYAGHVGLYSLQQWVEAKAPEWLMSGGTRTDPYENRTDLGRLGELKLSGTILLRVAPREKLEAPLLLHRASYDDYLGTTWVARAAAFAPLGPSGNATSWELAPGVAGQLRATIDDYSERGNPVLSLPPGAVRIEQLAASEMKRNPLGAVQIEIAPGHFRYGVEYGGATEIEAPPTVADLRLPRAEQQILAQLAHELRLDGASDAQAVARIKRFLAADFRYATFQSPQSGEVTPLAGFLLRTRAGHCEYFATATVLLARAAGVPARYATGFSVQEWSERERRYIVRQRHAHAWARVHVGGAWRDLDTTPPDWFGVEAAQDSGWRFAADLWSWIGFGASRATASLDRATIIGIGIPLGIALFAWLAWRMFRGRRIERAQAAVGAARHAGAGSDSEFYALEARLSALGYARERSEAMTDWLERIARTGPRLDIAAARAALALHYRYRFDPLGLAPAERVELARISRKLFAALAKMGSE